VDLHLIAGFKLTIPWDGAAQQSRVQPFLPGACCALDCVHHVNLRCQRHVSRSVVSSAELHLEVFHQRGHISVHTAVLVQNQWLHWFPFIRPCLPVLRQLQSHQFAAHRCDGLLLGFCLPHSDKLVDHRVDVDDSVPVLRFGGHRRGERHRLGVRPAVDRSFFMLAAQKRERVDAHQMLRVGGQGALSHLFGAHAPRHFGAMGLAFFRRQWCLSGLRLLFPLTLPVRGRQRGSWGRISASSPLRRRRRLHRLGFIFAAAPQWRQHRRINPTSRLNRDGVLLPRGTQMQHRPFH
jgi:hypothetical protein